MDAVVARECEPSARGAAIRLYALEARERAIGADVEARRAVAVPEHAREVDTAAEPGPDPLDLGEQLLLERLARRLGMGGGKAAGGAEQREPAPGGDSPAAQSGLDEHSAERRARLRRDRRESRARDQRAAQRRGHRERGRIAHAGEEPP